MKSIIAFFLILAKTTFSLSAAENTNNVVRPCNAEISIRLKEPAKENKTNEPIMLLVQITNLSTNETLMFRMENMPTDFTWTIISPSGKDLSPKASPIGVAISGWFPKLKPNESREADFDLSSVFNFNESGTYKIAVKKEVFRLLPKREKCEIVSTPLDIIISK